MTDQLTDQPTIRMTIISTRDQAELPRFKFEFVSLLSAFTFIMPAGLTTSEWTLMAAAAEECTDYGVRWGDSLLIEVDRDNVRFIATADYAGSAYQSAYAVPSTACVELFKRAAAETDKF